MVLLVLIDPVGVLVGVAGEKRILFCRWNCPGPDC